jgi:hypothetical protein
MELDIPSISAIIAATGVLVGVAIAVVELRHLVRQRRTDSLENTVNLQHQRIFGSNLRAVESGLQGL